MLRQLLRQWLLATRLRVVSLQVNKLPDAKLVGQWQIM
jgi:hypothetical protein